MQSVSCYFTLTLYVTLKVHPRFTSVYGISPAKQPLFKNLYTVQRFLHMPGSHLWCTDLESLGVEPRHLCIKRGSLGDSDMYSR